MGRFLTIIALVITIGVIALSIYNTKKLEKCSCSNNFNPKKHSMIAAIVLGIAALFNLIGIFIGGVSGMLARRVILILTALLVLAAAIIEGVAIKPTHEDCNCNGYKAKGMTLAVSSVAGIAALMVLVASFMP